MEANFRIITLLAQLAGSGQSVPVCLHGAFCVNGGQFPHPRILCPVGRFRAGRSCLFERLALAKDIETLRQHHPVLSVEVPRTNWEKTMDRVFEPEKKKTTGIQSVC
jgi:hypothetical protein